MLARDSAGFQLMIRGARHFNFADGAVLYNPVLRWTKVLGSIDGRRGLAITRRLLLAFFDRYLAHRTTGDF